jgi:hypothetical protein
MIKLLSVIALASKQIKQGQFSKYAVAYMLSMAQHTSEKFTKKYAYSIGTMVERIKHFKGLL